MKVLQLIDSLEAGGAERMAVNIANGLNSVKVESYLCVTRKEGILKESIENNANYLHLKKSSKFDIKAILKLVRFIKHYKIDIIHAHSSSFFMASIVKRFVPSIKIVWHDHYGKSEDLKNRDYKVLRLLSSSFSYIISVNEQLKNWAIKSLKCKNVVYLQNFAIPNQHKPQTNLYGQDNYRMVCLANLRPQKDHITLVKAFQQISMSHDLWTLHLVGKDFRDDYSVQIKSLIAKLELENKIFIYDSCPDVNSILSQCEIGILSSKSEGLPLALLEYGLANLSVITTNVGNCNKVITDNTMGLLIEPNHVGQLIDAISMLISDKPYRLSCASNLNRHILTNFSQKNYLEHVLQIYKSVMAKG